jgi:hypothetical protein
MGPSMGNYAKCNDLLIGHLTHWCESASEKHAKGWGAGMQRITRKLQAMRRSADFGFGATTASWLFPLTHWNWKVGLMTAVLRGLACVAALRHMEVHARNHFGVVEAAFVLLTCGFF